MEQQTVLVCIADQPWTLNALHLACALALNNGFPLALVKMLPVRHLSWLGTDLGYENFGEQDYIELKDYQEVAEDYGVLIVPHYFQFVTLSDAIVDAAEHVNAREVFATLPRSAIHYWRKYQLWSLAQQLQRQQRRLHTLEHPSGLTDWTPSITATATRK